MFLPSLTAWETLQFAAALRLPQQSAAAQEAAITQVNERAF